MSKLLNQITTRIFLRSERLIDIINNKKKSKISKLAFLLKLTAINDKETWKRKKSAAFFQKNIKNKSDINKTKFLARSFLIRKKINSEE